MKKYVFQIFQLSILLFASFQVRADEFVCPEFSDGALVGTVQAPAFPHINAIDEASGIAVSRHNPNVIWIHNDGNEEFPADYLFAVRSDGVLLGRYKITTGGQNLEDVAIGPGPDPNRDYLYAGYIGDNHNDKPYRRIMRVAEPLVDENQSFVAVDLTSETDRFWFVYPDGARDAETLMVDSNGDIYIVSKRRHDSTESIYPRVYRWAYPQESTSASNPVTLDYVASLPWSLLNGGGPTGGAISADGRHVIIRRYANQIPQATLWLRPPGTNLWDIFDDANRCDFSQAVPPTLLPLGPGSGGAEAITFDNNGNIFTVNEGSPAKFFRYEQLSTGTTPTDGGPGDDGITVPVGGTSECSDGIDNDNDQLADYPIDPGCAAPTGTENDNLSRTETKTYTWCTVDPSFVTKPIDCSTRGQIPSSLNNMVHFYWLDHRFWNYGGTAAGWQAHVGEAAQEAKTVTDQMPQGHRALFSFWMHRLMFQNELDMFPGSMIRSPWIDHGAQEVREMYQAFFEEYKRIGGQMDVFLLDDESQIFDSSEGPREMLHEIEADPRFATDIAPLINQPNLDSIENAMLDVNGNVQVSWWDTYERFLWSALATKIQTGYKRFAIYNSMAAPHLYPQVKASDYGDYYIDSHLFPFPDWHGHYYDIVGNCSLPLCQGQYQWAMGTHQGTSGYGRMGQLTWGIPRLNPPGVTSYPQTPFNSMRYAVNEVRGSKLSSSLPVTPWIANRSNEGDIPSTQISMASTDFYQETIFHYLLAGADNLAYWNPFATVQEDNLVSRTLREFDLIAGFQNAQSLVSEMVPYSKNYILSGIQVGGRKVYRLTFDLSDEIELDQVIKSESNENVIFELQNTRLTIPQGKIFRPAVPVSSKGFWIVQPLSASDPIDEVAGSTFRVNAGSDINVTISNNRVRLSGSAQGAQGPISFTWVKMNGVGDVLFSDPHDLQTEVQLTRAAQQSFAYTLRLMGFDGVTTAYDDIRIHVRPLGPTANAGVNRQVALPLGQNTVNVMLDGSGSSDQDRIITRYDWTCVSHENLDPSDVVKPTVSLGLGTYVFSLRVQDDDWEWSAPVQVQVNVLPWNFSTDPQETTSNKENKFLRLMDPKNTEHQKKPPIGYSLKKSGHVLLEVYSSQGDKIRTLKDEEHSAGEVRLVWDGKNDSGEGVASGSYTLILNVDGEVIKSKVVLIK